MKIIISGHKKDLLKKGILLLVMSSSNTVAIAGTESGTSTFYGPGAGASNTTGASNTLIGHDAGVVNTTGDFNTFIGAASGKENVSGTDNTFVGVSAGLHNTASENTFVGRDAGRNNADQVGNTFIGFEAGKANGKDAMNSVQGTQNSFVGYSAGVANTTGFINSFFGNSAGFSNTTGTANSFFGATAGQSNTTGSNNSFFGDRAGANNTTGFNNSFFGRSAGLNNTTGTNLSVFGRSANVAFGLTNASSIGFSAKVEQSHAMVLGSIEGVNGCDLTDTPACDYVDVGIGTTTPAAPLHIQRTTSSGPQEMFRFTNTGGSYITWEKTTGNQKWFFTHEDAAQGRFIIDHQDNGGLDGPEFALDTDGNITVQGAMNASGFNVVSDQNLKQGITKLDSQLVLAKMEQVPVSEWRYKSKPDTKHIGPMAQDFHAAFGLGEDDRHISPTDMAGVNLAAIKALKAQHEKAIEALSAEKDAEIAELQAGLKLALEAIEGMKVRIEAMDAANKMVKASTH